MERRFFLKGAGVMTVLVVGGGVWQAHHHGVFGTGDDAAYEPWRDWRSKAGEELALVRAAILAANPHNTQPWLFRISGSRIELYADTKRNTGALDPYLRELYIGLGCALENLILAASPNGYGAEVALVPGTLDPIPSNPLPVLVATVDLSRERREADDLYQAIPLRHTNRSPYRSQAVPRDLIDAIMDWAEQQPDVEMFLFTDKPRRDDIKQMMLRANGILYSDPEVERASDARWTRLEWSNVQKSLDGLTLDTFGQSAFTTAMMKMLPARSLEWAWRFGFWHTSYSEVLEATPLFGLIAVRNRYDRIQSLRAGRVWQHAHLLITNHGLAGRPVNEIVELVDFERLRKHTPQATDFLATLTGDANWQPTFMFRVGYPVRPAPASPRRPVQDTLRATFAGV